MAGNWDDILNEGVGQESPAPSPAAPTVGPVNKYEAALEEDSASQRQALQQSMYAASQKEPGRMADVLNTASTLNLDSDLVDRNLEQAKVDANRTTPDYDSILNDTPGLAKFLQDPNNATLSQHDLETMAQMDKAGKHLSKKEEEGMAGEFATAMGSGFLRLHETGWALLGVTGMVPTETALQGILQSKERQQLLQQYQPGYMQEFNQLVKKEGGEMNAALLATGSDIKQMARSMRGGGSIPPEQMLKNLVRDGAASIGEVLDFAYKTAVQRPRASFYSAVEQFPNSVPSLIAGAAGALATGGAGGALAGSFVGELGTEVGSQVDEIMQNKGIDTSDPVALRKAFSDPALMADIRTKAFKKGVTTAFVDMLGQAFGVKLLKDLPAGASALQKVGAFGKATAIDMAGEALGEGSGQAVREGSLAKVDYAEAFQEGLSSLFSGIGHTVIAKGMSGVKQGATMVQGDGGSVPAGSGIPPSAPPPAAPGLQLPGAEPLLAAPPPASAAAATTSSLGEGAGSSQAASSTSPRAEYSPDTVKAVQEISQDAKGASKSLQDAQLLSELGQHVAQLKHLQKVPGKITEFIDSVTGGEGKVYFDTQKWEQFWQERGRSPLIAAEQILGDGGRSYVEAKNSTGQLTLPMGAFIEHVSQTPEFQPLIQIVKTSNAPNAMSFDEAHPFLTQDLKPLMQQLAQEAEANPEHVAQPLHDEEVAPHAARAHEQLVAAGRPKEEAALQSQLFGSSLQAMKENYGAEIPSMKIPDFQGPPDIGSVEARTVTPEETQGKVKYGPDELQGPQTVQETVDRLKDALSSEKALNAELNKRLRTSEVVPALGNRIAFEEDSKNSALGFKHFAEMDLDGLKGFNTFLGYHAGTNAIRRVGEHLAEHQRVSQDTVRFYHTSGDEFFALFKNPEDAGPALAQIKGELKAAVFQEEDAHGAPHVVTGLDIGVGHGETQKLANAALEADKLARARTGERTDRLTEERHGDRRIAPDRRLPPNIQRAAGPATAQHNDNVGSANQPAGVLNQSGKSFNQAQQLAPPFYSKVKRLIEEKMGSTATVEQVRGLLKDTKEAERKAFGVEDFLKGKEKVSKEELLNHLRANDLQVKEVTLGGGDVEIGFDDARSAFIADAQENTDLSDSQIEKIANEIRVRGEPRNPVPEEIRGSAERYQRAFLALEEGNSGETKFEKYTLPGGTNYREVLFTLPPKTSVDSLPAGYKVQEFEHEQPTMRWRVIDPDGKVAGMGGSEERAVQDFRRVNREQSFHSSHWDETNVFAHARLKDDVGPNGEKRLRVEEIQSDWDLSGRQRGFKGDGPPDGFHVENKPEDGYRGMDFALVRDSDGGVVSRGATEAEAISRYGGGVPNFPFQKNWHEYTLKRIIRMAAEGGYDSVIWTTGEQQTERYFGDELVGPAVERWKKVTKPQSIGKLADNVFGPEMASSMPLQVVDGGVLAVLKHNKVRKTVVSLLPVNVVNTLASHHLSPNDLFSKKNVVFPKLSVDERSAVSIGVVDAIRQAGAEFRTKLRKLGDAGGEALLAPALSASNLNATEVAGLLDPERLFHLGTSNAPKTGATAGAVTETLSGQVTRPSGGKLASTELADLLNAHAVLIHGKEGLLQQGFQPPPGEGKKVLYDQIIPSFMNKIGKQFGAKVGETTVDGAILGTSREDLIDEETNLNELKKFRDRVPGELSIKDFGGEDGRYDRSDVVTNRRLDDLPVWVEGNAKEGLFASWDQRRKIGEYKNQDELAANLASDVQTFLEREIVDRQDFIAELKSNKHAAKAHSLPITKALRDSALTEGFTLFQDGHEPRASVFFGPKGTNIQFLKTADFSSFVHEFAGHNNLEVLAQLASQGNEKAKADLQTVLDWTGAKSWETFSTENHEKWARGVEKYLMEGEAPTPALKQVFERAKQYLIKIYKSLSALNVELTPEVRDVMARLIAPEKEVSKVEEEYGPPNPFGMVGPKADAFAKAVADADAAAKEILTRSLMKDFEKKQEGEYLARKDEVLHETEAEINALPVYKAIAALRDSQTPDGEPLANKQQMPKLSQKDIATGFGSKYLENLPEGVAVKDGGIHPNLVAENFGFKSGKEMLEALNQAPPKDDIIDKVVEQKMAERYPDLMLAGLSDEAVKAFHNEKRSQILRMQLEHLAENNLPQMKAGIRAIARRVPSEAAVKEQARQIIGEKQMSEVKPYIYSRASVKYAKEAGILFTQGDFAGAFEAKRKELLNHELFRAATDAQESRAKAEKLFKKVAAKDEKLAKSRNMDYVNAARAILAGYGYGNSEKTAQDYLAPIERYDAETYAAIRGIVDSIPAKGSVEASTYDEFDRMHEAIKALWSLARADKEMLIEGKRVEKEAAKEALGAQLTERGTEVRADLKRAVTKGERIGMHLLGLRSGLRRVESWVDSMDLGNPDGPFRRYIWEPISAAATQYRIEKSRVMQMYVDLVKAVEPSLTREPISAPELDGYEFKDKAHLLGALLHSGNDSNLSKLLRGYKWGELNEDGSLNRSKWDAFVGRAMKDGTITKADMDFVQGVWNLMESLKPALQAAHKEMYGHYFNEVTANEIQTPFGTYKGGYFPAKVDTFLVESGASNVDKDILKSGQNAFAFPSTGRGATMTRVEQYAAPLSMDLKMAPAHLDWAMRFLYLEPRVKEVARLLFDPKTREMLKNVDPTAMSDMLIPWLQRSASQQLVTPLQGWGGKGMSWFAQMLRRNTGLQIMAANAVNTAQQLTGLSISAVKVSPRFLKSALWQYTRGPKVMSDAIMEKSDFMKTRMDNAMSDAINDMQEILLNPNMAERSSGWLQKHAHFFQKATQNIVDNISWWGAYEQGIESGRTETESVKEADAAVRLTQGSGAAEDVSRLQTGNAIVRLFTMFTDYFNMQANLLGTEYAKISRTTGLKKGAGRALYVYMAGFLIPVVLSELLVRGGSGKADDNGDDEYLDDAFDVLFGSQFRAATAMLPIAGPVARATISTFNSNPFDDRLTTSPAATAIESAVKAPHDIYKAFLGEAKVKTAVRDTLTLLGLLTSLPLAPLAKPYSYLSDVSEGNANPTGPIDFTRGLITGKAGAKQ